jgi:hypothetical protein
MPPPNIDDLRAKIRESYGCDSRHVASEQVHEVFEGLTAWQGTVEVFDLIGNPNARRAYAWIYQDGNETKSVTVLGEIPISSPRGAVRAFIASKARK